MAIRPNVGVIKSENEPYERTNLDWSSGFHRQAGTFVIDGSAVQATRYFMSRHSSFTDRFVMATIDVASDTVMWDNALTLYGADVSQI